MVHTVSDKIAVTFKLESLLGIAEGGAGFYPAPD